MLRKIISLVLVFSLLSIQSGLAEVGQTLNLSNYLNQGPRTISPLGFQPPVLRYFSYDAREDNFQLLLDPQDLKDKLSDDQTKSLAQEQLNYFLVGLSLPNSKFWVNLRPDAPENIIEPELEQTEVGRIMLAADLQLKKDTAAFTSPQTKEGREYWDKLYAKAKELFGTEPANIPTITRPWIVPGEILIREDHGAASTERSRSASTERSRSASTERPVVSAVEPSRSAYVYKATLKVMLEEDYLANRISHIANRSDYSFKDPRMKELNSYSSQLIRELILPKLTQEVNSGKNYASLRQVYFSLVLSRWFKMRFNQSQVTGHKSQENALVNLIDSKNLTNLTSKTPWSKETYFKEYQKSFAQGEYNLKEQVSTPTGQVIRSYVSGGMSLWLMNLSGFLPLAQIPNSLPSGYDVSSLPSWELLGTIVVISGGAIYWSIRLARKRQAKKAAMRSMEDLAELSKKIENNKEVSGSSPLRLEQAKTKLQEAINRYNKDTKNTRVLIWPEEIKKIVANNIGVGVQEIDNLENLDSSLEAALKELREWEEKKVKALRSEPLNPANEEAHIEGFLDFVRSFIKDLDSIRGLLDFSPLTLEKRKAIDNALKEFIEGLKEVFGEFSVLALIYLKTGMQDTLKSIDTEAGLQELRKKWNESYKPALWRILDEKIGPTTTSYNNAKNKLEEFIKALEQNLIGSSLLKREEVAIAATEEFLKSGELELEMTRFYDRTEIIYPNSKDSYTWPFYSGSSSSKEMISGLAKSLAGAVIKCLDGKITKSQMLFAIVDVNIPVGILYENRKYVKIPYNGAVTLYEKIKKEISSSRVSSALNSQEILPEDVKRGGIDFILDDIEKYIQTDGSFKDVDLSLPLLSKAELEGFDPDKDMDSWRALFRIDTTPNDERLSEHLAGLFQKGQFSQRQVELLLYAQELCNFLSAKGKETTPGQRAFILTVDTGLFLKQGQAKASIKPSLN